MSAIPERRPPRHFSMLRGFHLADFFTLGNAACGMASVFFAMQYMATGELRHFLLSALMTPIALVFDVFDGRMARWRQQSSLLGRELDSLADVISFGVAPAVIAYGVGMQGLWDRIVLCFFVACGVSRLARFNVTAEQLSGPGGKVAYFEGTPIPTSIVLVALLCAAAAVDAIGPQLWGGSFELLGGTLHPLVLLYALSGSLMISRIRIPKL